MSALDQAADDLRIAAKNFTDALAADRAALDNLHKSMLDAKDTYDGLVSAYGVAYNRVVAAADTLDEITKALAGTPTPTQGGPVTGPANTPIQPAVNDNGAHQPAA